MPIFYIGLSILELSYFYAAAVPIFLLLAKWFVFLFLNETSGVLAYSIKNAMLGDLISPSSFSGILYVFSVY